MADGKAALGRRRRAGTAPRREETGAPRRVVPARLHALVRAVLMAAGSDEREGGIVADHLVEANLRGHDSHGVGMLPTYVRNRKREGTRANRRPIVVRDDGPFLVVDGDRGFGHVIGREATDLAIARARQLGVAVLAIRNACHMGRIGTYGEQCAAAGLVSVHFVNGIGHEPWVAPHGGKAPRFSTNPFCIAFPPTGAEPGGHSRLSPPAGCRGARSACGGTRDERCRMASCWMTLDGRPAIPR